MSLSGSKGRLSGLNRDLALKWETTRVFWRDAKAEELEQRWLTELRTEMDKTLAAIEKLDELFRKIRTDCE